MKDFETSLEKKPQLLLRAGWRFAHVMITVNGIPGNINCSRK